MVFSPFYKKITLPGPIKFTELSGINNLIIYYIRDFMSKNQCYETLQSSSACTICFFN